MNNLVRDLRQNKGWSQGELAERLGVSRQTINAIETRKYDPSLPLAFRPEARRDIPPLDSIDACRFGRGLWM
jgi:putative transcriptional regulator